MPTRYVELQATTGQLRTEGGHLVVPVVALMEGVIRAINSPCEEFIPLSTLAAAPSAWAGRPVTLGHPTKDGRQCSAERPGDP